MSDLSVNPDLPQWWTPSIDAAWLRSRDAALSDWQVQGARGLPMDQSIVEHALAFGHGARSAFPSAQTWDAVSARLAADWTTLGNVGLAAWETVAAIVRHEWLRAAGPGGDAAPDPAAGSPSAAS